MTYSVNQKCSNCKKLPTCVDGEIIRGAFHGIIHSLSQAKGHQGWGVINHDCQGFQEKDPIINPPL